MYEDDSSAIEQARQYVIEYEHQDMTAHIMELEGLNQRLLNDVDIMRGWFVAFKSILKFQKLDAAERADLQAGIDHMLKDTYNPYPHDEDSDFDLPQSA